LALKRRCTGCVRVHNVDVNALIDTVNTLANDGDPITNISLETTLPLMPKLTKGMRMATIFILSFEAPALGRQTRKADHQVTLSLDNLWIAFNDEIYIPSRNVNRTSVDHNHLC
jgi:hypothetical protein